jgi:chromosomal replication initiation ATPase DnaA
MFVSDLIKETCEVFDVSRRDLMGQYRFPFIVRARFALYKALRMRGMSLPKIAGATGRHHTTVMNGLEKADLMMKNCPDYRQKVERIASLSRQNFEF